MLIFCRRVGDIHALFRLRFPCTNRASRFDFDDSICHLGIEYVRRPWQVPLDRAEPVNFRSLTEPRDRDSRRFYAICGLFHENQSLHGGFILPIQFDNFFYSEQNRVSAVKRCRPARAVAQPQIENNIRLDAVFKSRSILLASLSVTATKESFAAIAASLLSSTLLTTGSTSLLKSYSLESRSHFRQAPAKSHGRILSMHPNQRRCS